RHRVERRSGREELRLEALGAAFGAIDERLVRRNGREGGDQARDQRGMKQMTMNPDGKFAHGVLGRLYRDSPGVLSEQTDNASRLSGAWQPRSGTLFWPSRGSALAARFEQADAGGDRDIERSHCPEQRNRDDPIAKLARQPAQPRSFSAEHPGERAGQVGLEQV